MIIKYHNAGTVLAHIKHSIKVSHSYLDWHQVHSLQVTDANPFFVMLSLK